MRISIQKTIIILSFFLFASPVFAATEAGAGGNTTAGGCRLNSVSLPSSYQRVRFSATSQCGSIEVFDNNSSTYLSFSARNESNLYYASTEENGVVIIPTSITDTGDPVTFTIRAHDPSNWWDYSEASVTYPGTAGLNNGTRTSCIMTSFGYNVSLPGIPNRVDYNYVSGGGYVCVPEFNGVQGLNSPILTNFVPGINRMAVWAVPPGGGVGSPGSFISDFVDFNYPGGSGGSGGGTETTSIEVSVIGLPNPDSSSWTISPGGYSDTGDKVVNVSASVGSGSNFSISANTPAGCNAPVFSSSDGQTNTMYLLQGDSKIFNITYSCNPPATVDIKANSSDGPIALNSGQSATLSWTSTNAVSCTASNAWSGTKGTSGPSESTGVLSAGNYTYTIVCSNSSGSMSSPDSVNIDVTSSGSAPSSPTTFTATASSCGTGTIDLAWGSSSGATSYKLYRNGLEIYNGVALSFSDTGRTAGVSYTYTVTASNGAGTSAPSSTSPVGTSAPDVCGSAPSTPTGLTVTASSTCGTGTINVSWNASSGATSYTLRDGSTTIYTGTSTSFSHTGLVAGSSHSYTVLASNSTGPSSYSSAVNGTAPSACVAVTCAAPATNAFTGCYYDNMDFTNIQVSRADAYPLNFDWGNGSPDPLIGPDTFSSTWNGNFTFSTATYRFTSTADDGVRVYVDGVLKIDRWIDQGPTTYTADVVMSAGSHLIKMEYYENAGGAVAKLSWAVISTTGTINVSEVGASGGAWVIGGANTYNPPSPVTAVSGIYNISVTPPSGFTVSSIDGDSVGNNSVNLGVSQTKQFTINYSPVPTPVVTISASPTSGTAGVVNPQLTWSATNSPTSCTASGDWSGAKAVSGTNVSQGVLNTVKTYTYTLTCANGGGSGPASSATVNVTAPTTGTISVVEVGATGGTWAISGPATYGPPSPATNVTPGTYSISATPPSGYVLASPPYDGDSAGVNSVNLGSGQSKQFTIRYSPVSSTFNYSLSANNVSVVQGGAGGQSTVTQSLVTSPSEPVTITATGMPSGVTVSYTATRTCNPNCTSPVTFTPNNATPGSYTITISGLSSPTGVVRSTTMTLTVIAPTTFTASISPSSPTGNVGSPIRWTCTASGGIAPYTYTWSGTDIISPGPNSPTLDITYQTVGAKTASCTVLDSSSTGNLTAASSPKTVQIIVDPQFKEF